MRVIVERAFGKLKCQWRCLLKQLKENTPKVPYLTIIICCILHNIRILHSDELENSDYSSDDDDDEDDDNPPAAFRQGRIILSINSLTKF